MKYNIKKFSAESGKSAPEMVSEFISSLHTKGGLVSKDVSITGGDGIMFVGYWSSGHVSDDGSICI